MTFNVIALLGIIKVISKKSLRYREESRPLRVRFHIVFGFIIIFSLTWLFGALLLIQDRVEFQYIFCLVNVLQGCYIFVLYGAKQRKIRTYWCMFLTGQTVKDIRRKSIVMKFDLSNHNRRVYPSSLKTPPSPIQVSGRHSIVSVLSAEKTPKFTTMYDNIEQSS